MTVTDNITSFSAILEIKYSGGGDIEIASTNNFNIIKYYSLVIDLRV